MPGPETAGRQLYAHLAELLAPAEALGNSACLVILEPAGKDVAALGATTGPERDEAIADLANTVPAAAASFLPTLSTYDDLWNDVLMLATPSGGPGDPAGVTVSRLLADNRAGFEMMARARLDVSGDLYHPVRMVPKEWLGEEGWASVALRIGGAEPTPVPETPPFVVIPEEIPELEWREIEPLPIDPPILVDPLIDREPPIPVDPVDPFEPDPFDRAGPVDPGLVEPELVDPTVVDADVIDGPDVGRFLVDEEPVVVGNEVRPEVLRVLEAVQWDDPIRLTEGTTWQDIWTATRSVDVVATVAAASPPASGFELSFDYRVVGIDRPWLQPLLLGLGGWTMPGFEAESISNGLPIGNPGLMPVITTRLLVVRNLQVKANWTDADRAKADAAGTISFGPFAISGAPSFDGSTLSHPGPQVVAWLGTVVPPCPRVG
jgi:hypothetical protein